MIQLPREYAEYLQALVEGREPWSGWPRWFAMYAHRLARLLPRDHMQRLRQDAPGFLPLLLTEIGATGRPTEENAATPGEWVLAICEDMSSLPTLSRLREALELPVVALADLRRRLPGVYRRGPQDELERLAARLEQQGLRASAFPAWELVGPPTDEPDPIADEEYEVYTATCHTNLLRFELPDVTFYDLVGDDAVCREPVAQRFRGQFHNRLQAHPETLADYERRNAEGGRLRKRFRTRGGYQLLSEQRRKDLCWEGGLVFLTRAGFGRSGTLALVGLSYYGGFGCSLLFEKKGDAGWQLWDRYGTWVS